MRMKKERMIMVDFGEEEVDDKAAGEGKLIAVMITLMKRWGG